MRALLKSLCGPSLRTLRWLLVSSGILLMVGCSNPLDLLSGGTNVAANVQAGKTNTQTLGTTNNTEQSIVRPQARIIKQSSDRNKVASDSVEYIEINEIPPWVILLLILGWLLPSPGEMGRSLVNIFRRKK
jgi:hypothetical protein